MDPSFARGADRRKLIALMARDPIVLTTYERPAVPGGPACPIEWASPSFTVPRTLVYCVAQVQDSSLPGSSSIRFVRDMMTTHTIDRVTVADDLTLVVLRPEESLRVRVRCVEHAPAGLMRVVGWSQPAEPLIA